VALGRLAEFINGFWRVGQCGRWECSIQAKGADPQWLRVAQVASLASEVATIVRGHIAVKDRQKALKVVGVLGIVGKFSFSIGL
jgi:hypothetical protein